MTTTLPAVKTPEEAIAHLAEGHHCDWLSKPGALKPSAPKHHDSHHRYGQDAGGAVDHEHETTEASG